MPKIELIYRLQRAKQNGAWEDLPGKYPTESNARAVQVGRQMEAAVTDSGESFRILEIRTRVLG